MATIKLFNKGQREISGDGWVLKPERAMEFDEATGAYLKGLYGNELLSLDDVQKQFDAAPTEKQGEPAAAEKESAAPKKSGGLFSKKAEKPDPELTPPAPEDAAITDARLEAEAAASKETKRK